MAHYEAVIIKADRTKTYQVKCFINGYYDPDLDYFTASHTDAKSKQAFWKRKNSKQQGDFCKEEIKKQADKKTSYIKETTDWPIYIDTDIIGWITLPEGQDLPKVLCIQDKAYIRTNLSKICE